MFKLTSLNLNGIRSASRKGLQAWLEKERPDCMCVQELKAQQAGEWIERQLDDITILSGNRVFRELLAPLLLAPLPARAHDPVDLTVLSARLLPSVVSIATVKLVETPAQKGQAATQTRRRMLDLALLHMRVGDTVQGVYFVTESSAIFAAARTSAL